MEPNIEAGLHKLTYSVDSGNSWVLTIEAACFTEGSLWFGVRPA